MPAAIVARMSPLQQSQNNNFPTLISTALVPSNPKEPIRLSCGLYESSMPEPRFWLDVNPAPDYADNFVATLKRIEGNGEYELVYFFDNYGGPDYTVSVWSSDNSSETER